MSEKNTGMVTLELDRDTPLTEAESEQIQRLTRMSDDEIDFSDAPHTRGGDSWTRVAGLESAVALEEDLLIFYSKNGAPDASRINAVLREYMRTHAEHS